MPSRDAKTAAVRAELAALRSEVSVRLQKDLQALRADGAQLDFTDRTSVVAARDRCHTLAGTALTFSYESLGRQLRSLEYRLESGLDADEFPQGASVHQAFLALPEVLPPPPQDPETHNPATGSKHRRVLYLFSGDGVTADLIRLDLEHLGYAVTTFANSNPLIDAFERMPPLALLVEIRESDPETVARLHLAKDLCARHDRPLLTISRTNSFGSRLLAIRSGSNAFFPLPLDQQQFERWVEMATGNRAIPPFRIVLASGDADFLGRNAALLVSEGCDVTSISSARGALDAIGAAEPDLVVADTSLTDCSAEDLVQIIRMDEDLAHLPVLLMSGDGSWVPQRSALLGGADGALPRSAAQEEFVAIVLRRAARSRQVHRRLLRDGLTGLLQHMEIKERLAREVRLAERTDQDVVVAMVDIDHFKRVNDEFGHPVGDRVIRTLAKVLVDSLRSSDLIGRYGGEEFVAVLPGATLQAATSRIKKVLSAFSHIEYALGSHAFHCTCSAGVALLAKGEDHESLIRRADKALYAAKEAGRNQVVVAN